MIKNFINSVLEITPSNAFNYTKEMLILSAILIIASLIFSIFYNKQRKNNIAFKKSFRKTSKRLATFGIIFLILTGIRSEQIPFFSMRLWLYGTFIFFIYSMIFSTIKSTKEYKKITKDLSEKSEKRRNTKNEKVYLPNK